MKNQNGLYWAKSTAIIGMLFITAAFGDTEGAQDFILGKWYTKGCQAIFDFYREGKEYRARMYPLKSPKLLDGKNPVDSLKKRNLSGIIAVAGLVYDSKKRQWTKGKIYNPRDGGTYSCYCIVKNNGKELYFRGFIGSGILGGSQIWTRANCEKN